ncbi:hypothetical protein ACFC1R_30710, partial [Kitasatospora sp. NPDC056138]
GDSPGRPDRHLEDGPLPGRLKNGTRAITVSLPADQRVHFRYRFDDVSAVGHDGCNSYLHT